MSFDFSVDERRLERNIGELQAVLAALTANYAELAGTTWLPDIFGGIGGSVQDRLAGELHPALAKYFEGYAREFGRTTDAVMQSRHSYMQDDLHHANHLNNATAALADRSLLRTTAVEPT